ncbi:MAG TPA: hypothetical protein VFE46_01815 [Pirellulales bacterium]|nr:hypothetical protein [Pirellulales bacterium]
MLDDFAALLDFVLQKPNTPFFGVSFGHFGHELVSSKIGKQIAADLQQINMGSGLKIGSFGQIIVDKWAQFGEFRLGSFRHQSNCGQFVVQHGVERANPLCGLAVNTDLRYRRRIQGFNLQFDFVHHLHGHFTEAH